MSWAEDSKERQKKLDRQWRLIGVAGWILRHVPHGVALRMGAALGSLYRLVAKKRVDNAEVRCCAVLCLGPSEGRRVVRESMRNAGRALAEMLRLPLMMQQGESYCHMTGEHHLDVALAQGKGAVLLLGHIDNWEVANYVLSRRWPLHVIAAPQRDPRVTDLLSELRSRAGARVVTKGGTLKAALRCLDAGEVLGVLLDQDAKDKGMMVPFLGIEASTPTPLMKAALRRGTPVVPVRILRRGTGAVHDLEILPPLSEKEDLRRLMEQCNRFLSRTIEEYPEQWLLWSYPRWGRPEPEVWRDHLVY